MELFTYIFRESYICLKCYVPFDVVDSCNHVVKGYNKHPDLEQSFENYKNNSPVLTSTLRYRVQFKYKKSHNK